MFDAFVVQSLITMLIHISMYFLVEDTEFDDELDDEELDDDELDGDELDGDELDDEELDDELDGEIDDELKFDDGICDNVNIIVSFG